MRISKTFDRATKELLLGGGIGIIPTDTIYGVVGSAFSKKAVERIYRLKQRDAGKPFIILISDYADLLKFGVKLSKDQEAFSRARWSSGRPASVALPVKGKKFAYLHRGTNFLAFRIARPLPLRNLLRLAGPLVAPSANPTGLEPAKNIKEALAYFGHKVDFYVDHGILKGKPSSLTRLNLDGSIEVLRK